MANPIKTAPNRFPRISIKRVNVLLVFRQEINQIIARAIANSEPDEFWRMAVEQTALLEVGIFGNDGKTVITRVLPNLFICCALESAIPQVQAARILRGKQSWQFGRKVLIKEQLHREQPLTATRGQPQKQSKLGCLRRSGLESHQGFLL